MVVTLAVAAVVLMAVATVALMAKARTEVTSEGETEQATLAAMAAAEVAETMEAKQGAELVGEVTVVVMAVAREDAKAELARVVVVKVVATRAATMVVAPVA